MVTSAMKVSRTAHEPASCAPLTGSCERLVSKSCRNAGHVIQKGLTVTIRTHRNVAEAMTRIPPPNKTIKPNFFQGLRLDCHSIGSGIDSRYMSVITLKP